MASAHDRAFVPPAWRLLDGVAGAGRLPLGIAVGKLGGAAE
jgi:hypothetical protein